MIEVLADTTILFILPVRIMVVHETLTLVALVRFKHGQPKRASVLCLAKKVAEWVYTHRLWITING